MTHPEFNIRDVSCKKTPCPGVGAAIAGGMGEKGYADMNRPRKIKSGAIHV